MPHLGCDILGRRPSQKAAGGRHLFALGRRAPHYAVDELQRSLTVVDGARCCCWQSVFVLQLLGYSLLWDMSPRPPAY